jgi:hypothetical protein
MAKEVRKETEIGSHPNWNHFGNQGSPNKTPYSPTHTVQILLVLLLTNYAELRGLLLKTSPCVQTTRCYLKLLEDKDDHQPSSINRMFDRNDAEGEGVFFRKLLNMSIRTRPISTS